MAKRSSSGLEGIVEMWRAGAPAACDYERLRADLVVALKEPKLPGRESYVLDGNVDKVWLNLYGDVPAALPRIRARHLAVLRQLWPNLQRFCRQESGLDAESLLPLLWLFLIPLGLVLSSFQAKEQRPVVQGMLGPPGAGKSVTAAILALIVRELGHRPVVLSIDDLYFSRSRLEVEVLRHPMLRWRGPPGTHDVTMGVDFFESVHSGSEIVKVPRFDKSLSGGLGDFGGFEHVVMPDLIIFEGWIVGLKKREEKRILDWSREDGDRSVDLALRANELLRDYYGLWAFLDKLMLLHVADVGLIRRWRLEAERVRRECGLGAMTEEETEGFVDYLLGAIPPAVHYRPLVDERRGIDVAVVVDRERRWAVAPWSDADVHRGCE